MHISVKLAYNTLRPVVHIVIDASNSSKSAMQQVITALSQSDCHVF